MAYSRFDKPLTVVEGELFLRQSQGLWDDEDRAVFIDYISMNPEAGDIIPDSHGVRKIRWGRKGIGKRGGVRIIYFVYDEEHPLYLLMMYAKSQQSNISPDGKRIVKHWVDDMKRLWSKGRKNYHE